MFPPSETGRFSGVLPTQRLRAGPVAATLEKVAWGSNFNLAFVFNAVQSRPSTTFTESWHDYWKQYSVFTKIIGHVGHFRWLGPNVWWEISQIWIEYIKPIGQMSDEPWKFFMNTEYFRSFGWRICLPDSPKVQNYDVNKWQLWIREAFLGQLSASPGATDGAKMIILWVNIWVRSPPSWNSVFGTTWPRFSRRPDFGPGPAIQLGINLISLWSRGAFQKRVWALKFKSS